MLIGCCANNLTEGIAAFPGFSQGGDISHEAKSLICHERWESGTIFSIPSRPSHTQACSLVRRVGMCAVYHD